MSRIWIVNLASLGLGVWGAFEFRAQWNAFAEAHAVAVTAATPPAVAAPAALPAVVAVAEAWTDIPARNPFSFDRNDIDLMPAVVETPRVSPPKPVLFGVVDLGSGRRAMLGNFGARSSSQAVKVGEKFGAWIVSKIEPKSVVVTGDGVEETLELGTPPVDRDAGKTAAAGVSSTVVTTASPVAATPAAPTVPAAPRPGLAPGTSVVAPPGTRVTQTPFGPVIEQVP